MLKQGLILAALLLTVCSDQKQFIDRYMNDVEFRRDVDQHFAQFPTSKIVNGEPNFNCPNMVSQNTPTTVHSLRPGDIKLIASLGESLTAGNGAEATNILEILLQYRGESFSMGGDDTLDTRVTLPNIIKKFNPQLFGQSYKIGSTDVWDIAYLNAGIPGDIASDMPGQALDLIARMQRHPDKIDIQNDWKIISLFIGSNDACHYCQDEFTFSPANYSAHIRKAVQILYDNVPRVIVNIIGPIHVEIARQVDASSPLCKTAHTLIECQCEYNHNFTDQAFSDLVTQYQQAVHDIMMSGDFDKRPDFSLVVQPFYNRTVQPPLNPDGTPNLSLFAPDCFHFRGPLHSAVARILWNSMIVPVGQKPQQFNFTNIMAPLNCPDPACPFIRTTKNSVQCSQFWTAPRA